MQDELRKQENISRDRKSQIEELKQKLEVMDKLVLSKHDKTEISLIEQLRQQIEEQREKTTAEITEQSEKHLERERHLSSQILSYQTEMATYKETKGALHKEIQQMKQF